MNFLTSMYVKAQTRMQSLLKNEDGATMVEYALMLALIAVVCLTAVGLVGTNANLKYEAIKDALAP